MHVDSNTHLSKQLSLSKTVVYLAMARLVVHLVVNAAFSYGLFRDEPYYLACSDHLGFGYVDHPFLSLVILVAQTLIFGDSLFAIGVLPAVAGAVTVLLTGLIARDLGGGRFAQSLSALGVLLVPAYLATNGFYSMNALDILSWTIVVLVLIRLTMSAHRNLWITLGIVVGLGLLNKLSMLFLGVGIIGGLLLSEHRGLLKSKLAWLAFLIVLMISLPIGLWQFANG